jgi:hypothetical protein
MADNEGARKTGKAYVVCTTPDVCLTSGCPVPYSIISYLDTATLEVASVKMTGQCALNMDSRLPMVIGDVAGTGGGLSSGVNLGYCIPISHSTSVRAEGRHVLYNSSQFWMNCAGQEGMGNTKGKLFYLQVENFVGTTPDGIVAGDTEPPLEKADEHAWYQEAFDTIGNAASDAWGATADTATAVWQKAKELNDNYQVMTRLGGAAQFIGGEAETVLGGGLLLGAEAVLPAIAGVALIGSGQDNAVTGWHNMIDPQHPMQSAITRDIEAVAQSLGASPEQAAQIALWIKTFVELGLTLGAGGLQSIGTTGVRITAPTAEELLSAHQMYKNAIKKLLESEGTSANKAQLFEELATDISRTWPGWKAVPAASTDGSQIFIGTQGQVLVISPEGALFNGPVQSGLKSVGPELFTPDYSALKPLE